MVNDILYYTEYKCLMNAIFAGTENVSAFTIIVHIPIEGRLSYNRFLLMFVVTLKLAIGLSNGLTVGSVVYY